MTKRFDFRDNSLKIDIAGEVFELDSANPKFVQRVVDFGNDATAKAEELGKKNDYIEATKELISFCLESIDAILGKGSSKRIFKDREVGLFDALDVTNYIVTEIKTDRDVKFKAYTPSRAERRAK